MPPTAYWSQTGRRHDEACYIELNKNLLSLTFGGSFLPQPYPKDLSSKLAYNFNRLLLKTVPGLRASGKKQFLIQFDSWRLWESFISNACPVHVRFEDWAMQFPVMPVEGQHYIGVHGLDFEGTARRISNMSPEEIQQISRQGRQWALDNYSPKAMATIFLKECAQMGGSGI